MASQAIDLPTGSLPATTERGGKLQYTEAEVELGLRLMILNGGNATLTAKMLKEQGIRASKASLLKWRSTLFPRLYRKLMTEMGREVGEEIAGRAYERAIQADKAEEAYLAKAEEKLDEVPAKDLAKSVQALAMAKEKNVSVGRLLKEQPTSIEKVDINASIATLERLKVVQPAEEVIDAEAVDG